jgi:hypothetical protein
METVAREEVASTWRVEIVASNGQAYTWVKAWTEEEARRKAEPYEKQCRGRITRIDRIR